MKSQPQEICRPRPGLLGVFFAFVTGAGVATTAILLSQKTRTDAAASAEQLLKKCSQAVEALDSQASAATV